MPDHSHPQSPSRRRFVSVAAATVAAGSPPCAANFSYPRRFMRMTQARAVRSGLQPVVVGLPENP
jgi:hypothetical protein